MAGVIGGIVAAWVLQNDLCAQFDHAIRRQLEEAGRADGVAEHGDEQFLLPERHITAHSRDQGFTAEEEGGVHHVQRQPLLGTPFQRMRQIDIVLETIKNLYGENTITSEHIQNNESVRKLLTERDIKPEELPPAEDLKKLERKVKSDEKKMIKQSALPKNKEK